jgi:hypothetical protein
MIHFPFPNHAPPGSSFCRPSVKHNEGRHRRSFAQLSDFLAPAVLVFLTSQTIRAFSTRNRLILVSRSRCYSISSADCRSVPCTVETTISLANFGSSQPQPGSSDAAHAACVFATRGCRFDFRVCGHRGCKRHGTALVQAVDSLIWAWQSADDGEHARVAN